MDFSYDPSYVPSRFERFTEKLMRKFMALPLEFLPLAIFAVGVLFSSTGGSIC